MVGAVFSSSGVESCVGIRVVDCGRAVEVWVLAFGWVVSWVAKGELRFRSALVDTVNWYDLRGRDVDEVVFYFRVFVGGVHFTA